MDTTLALRTVVVAKLTEVMPQPTEQYPDNVSKIYYMTAQDDHPKIYAVYTLDLVDNTDGRLTWELEINVMDYGKNTATVENLADSIQKKFDKLVVINSDIGVYFFADRRNSVEEEDRNILRRRLTFSTYTYER